MTTSVFREPLLSVLAAIGLLSLGTDLRAAAGQEPESEAIWTLVHGSTEQYGQLDIEKIAQIYLKGRKWKLAAADDLDPAILDGPVFAVGSLDDNIVAQALTLGTLTSGRQYLGRELEPGVGYVLAGRGERGQPYCVFTGLDDDAVFQCFTTSVDVSQPREFVIRQGKLLLNWAWPGGGEAAAPDSKKRRPLVHDPASTALAILDLESDVVQDGLDLAERAELAAHAMAGYGDERRLIDRNLDHLPTIEASRQHMLGLLSRNLERLNEVLSWTRGRKLNEMVDRIYRGVETRFGPGRKSAPAVFLLLDGPAVTNARTVGVDLATGRPRVVLNLACFPTERSFRIALVHEFIHCLQLDEHGNLPDDPMLVEGVAVLLSGRLIQDASPDELMMWPSGRFAWAKSVEVEAAKRFRAQSRKGEELHPWFTLNVNPLGGSFRDGDSSHLGRSEFPDRMGYYLGWQAARGWLMANETAQAADMLRLPAGALIDFMPDKFRILDPEEAGSSINFDDK
jgi:hypothetical protein